LSIPLKSDWSTTLTGNSNAILQGRLPQKKREPKNSNSIGTLSIKEARCSPGEGILSLLIGKIERFLVQLLTVTLALAYRSVETSHGMMEDIMEQD